MRAPPELTGGIGMDTIKVDTTTDLEWGRRACIGRDLHMLQGSPKMKAAKLNEKMEDVKK